MEKAKNIIEYCQEYLETAKFDDGCYNGLQVEGKGEVKKIIAAVSLSEELIKKSLALQADMIMVHHGFFAGALPSPLELKGFNRQRLKMLLENDINLAGFHLPLDFHPEIGNNISLCKLLKIKDPEYLEGGYIGELPQKMDFQEFVQLVDKKLHTKSITIQAGPDRVKKVAIISGGASPEFILAKEAGADTYITGDIREHTVREVEEEKINFINAGHYNTEKLGIQNLGELVAKKFDVEVEFIDIPNEI
jgi:dinuclear metal center YbgI/SA1388 family protein